MATPTQKGSKKPKTKPRKAPPAESIAALKQTIEAQAREIREGAERQAATSAILRMIAKSPTDLQSMLNMMAENAARLCAADDAQILQLDEDVLRRVASYGSRQTAETRPLTRDIVVGRSVIDRQTVHVHDIRAAQDQGFPGSSSFGFNESRTLLGVPLLRGETPIGVILIRRFEVRPFSDSQISLLKTFADQAVIAIENVKLFRQLKESLEQQTATSEILGVVASSPTDVQPVFDAIVKSATRLCDASFGTLHRFDGEMITLDAQEGMSPEQLETGKQRFPTTPVRNTAVGRAISDRQVVHIEDVHADAEYILLPHQREEGYRTVLAVPLLKDGNPIGALGMWRREVKPFTDSQIALVKTFADQAVIALENVRLFNELKESLEQQTATSEILGVIASSPTDIQPVLEAVAASAARLCDASDAVIHRYDGEWAQPVTVYGPIGPTRPAGERVFRPTRLDPPGRAMLDGKTIHVEDIVAELDTEFPESRAHQRISGSRTILVTPLLREGASIGSIMIRRTEVRPFSEKQIKLLETFAAQAAIAIENVRLFKELEERNRGLIEALEQQTATAEILGVIASSPNDLQPVFQTILDNSVRLCEAQNGAAFQFDGEVFRAVVWRNVSEELQAYIENTPIRPGRESALRRVGLEKRPVHIPDMLADPECVVPEPYRKEGMRSNLAVPLLKDNHLVGAIAIHRQEVRPFTDAQIRLLETFASQAVIAIENVRLFQELQQRTRELVESVEEMKALSEVGQTVSSTLDLDKVLETIVARAVDLSGTDGGIIYEYDEVLQEFNLRASHRMEAEAVEALGAARIRLGEGATGQAASTRAPVQIADTFEERQGAVSRVRPVLNRLGYRSLVTVPILREQQIMGGLTVWRKRVGEFEPEVVNLLQTFATQSALAIHNARLFRELEAKGRELEAANRHKSEFLANVSHELRTPLNAIIGFSEVLLEKMFGELNEKQNEYVDDILSSGRHLLSLINDILDLSKIEAGRMELEVSTFDLPLAVENALLLIRERASRHGIKLDRMIDNRLGDFTGDERKIKQILVNLLSNAVKFTPEGGQIKVEASLGDSSVIISVGDTGIGIAKEDQEAIFEEFRQASGHYAHKREGTGLGLALTRRFVEMHGGKIWVESEPGRGSKFTFTLPVS